VPEIPFLGDDIYGIRSKCIGKILIDQSGGLRHDSITVCPSSCAKTRTVTRTRIPNVEAVLGLYGDLRMAGGNTVCSAVVFEGIKRTVNHD
jgi:hypothetical protein